MGRTGNEAVRHRSVVANDIRIHLAEQGSGPPVLLCHGFPELWYAFRHQLPALAAAGFRAIAPDLRGYGQTDRPEALDQYTLFHLVGDLVGVLDALDIDSAALVGHDWGAVLAWHAALLRPDRFRAVAALSVPFRPRSPARPTRLMPRTAEAMYYPLYFQEPGLAESELERDVSRTLRFVFGACSGDAQGESGAQFSVMVAREGLLARSPREPALPGWLSSAELEFYVSELERTGFRGGLSWYRSIDRNWELSAALSGATINVPALYVAGDRDPTLLRPGVDPIVAELPRWVPQLRRTITLPGCGHWPLQERPREVNDALTEFLRDLPTG